MATNRNAFLAGLFMLISIALIIMTIIGIKGAGRLTDPADVRTVRFALSDNVGGLRIGDDAKEFVKSLREKLNPIIERYNAVADSGKGALDKIKGFFGETSGNDFQSTMANLKTATGDVKEKLPAILEKVDTALAKSHGT